MGGAVSEAKHATRQELMETQKLLKATKDHSDTVQQDATRLKGALESEMNKKKNLKEKLDGLEAECDRMRHQVAEMHRGKERMAETIGESKEREKNQNADMAQLVQTLKALEAKLEIEKKKYDIVLNEGKRYEGETLQLKQSLADTVVQKKEFEKEADDLKETEFRLRNQIGDMERLTSQQQMANHELSRQLATAADLAKSTEAKHRSHVRRLADEITALKNKNGNQQQVLGATNKQLADLKEKFEEKSDKLDSESEKLEKLREAQLDTDRKLCQLYNNIRNTFQLRNSPPTSNQFVPSAFGNQTVTNKFPFTTLSGGQKTTTGPGNENKSAPGLTSAERAIKAIDIETVRAAMEDIIKQCKSSEDAKNVLEQEMKLKQHKLNEVTSQYQVAEGTLKQMREKYDEAATELTKANVKLDSYRKMQKTQSEIVAKKEEDVSSNEKKITELELDIAHKNTELSQLREKNSSLSEEIKTCKGELVKLNKELAEQSNLKQREHLIRSQCDDHVNFALSQLRHKEDDVKDLKERINELTKELIGQKASLEYAHNDKKEIEAKMKEKIESLEREKREQIEALKRELETVKSAHEEDKQRSRVDLERENAKNDEFSRTMQNKLTNMRDALAKLQSEKRSVDESSRTMADQLRSLQLERQETETQLQNLRASLLTKEKLATDSENQIKELESERRRVEGELRALQNEVLLRERESRDRLDSLLRAEKDKQTLQLRVDKLQSETAKQKEYDLSRTQATAIGHLLDTVTKIEINQAPPVYQQAPAANSPVNQMQPAAYNLTRTPSATRNRSMPTADDFQSSSRPSAATNHLTANPSAISATAFNPHMPSSSPYPTVKANSSLRQPARPLRQDVASAKYPPGRLF